MIQNITDYSFKGSLIQGNFEVVMKRTEHKGKYSWHFVDAKLFSFFKGLVFPRNHHLFSKFNEKVMQLISGGFFDYWISNCTKSVYNTEKPAVVLTLYHVSIGFQIWALMLLISTLVFLYEMLRYWGAKTVKVLLFEIIIRRFYQGFKLFH